MTYAKSYRDMTDAELKQEYAWWDLKVREAGQWGAALAFADEQRQAVENEQRRRQEEGYVRRPR